MKYLELFREQDGNDKLVLIAQNTADAVSLEKMVAKDRTVMFAAKWESSMRLALEAVHVPAPVASDALETLNDADLRERAAMAGVQWDKKASKQTMIDRIRAGKGELVTA